MSEAAIPKRIEDELRQIKSDLENIKERMVDIDSIMTEDDYGALQEYRKEEKAGLLMSHKQVKEELGL
ncbi:MAG: hypothetical protein V1837_04655 [Candidatus Woesearchaeota archaeon]